MDSRLLPVTEVADRFRLDQGGALATPVALFLARQAWPISAVFQVYTFAAPTAGDAQFASAFEAAFPGTDPAVNSSWRVYNDFDVVPNAWATLSRVETYYPSPGAKATLPVTFLMDGIELYAGDTHYVQPDAAGSAGAMRLSDGYTLYDGTHVRATFNDLLAQLAFQRGTNTYLKLLGVDQTVNYQPDVATVPTPDAVSGVHGVELNGLSPVESGKG